MRQIKFRAWDGEKMRYPNLVNTSHSYDPFTCYTSDNLEPSFFNAKELMQFTSLLDRTGKEIYEGDILVDALKKMIYVVKFGHCKKYAFTGWYVESELDQYTTRLNGDYYEDRNNNIEIIGNIYENPELLK